MRQQLSEDGLSDGAISLFQDSWRKETHKAYNTYIQQYLEFLENLDSSSKKHPNHIKLANFLHHLYSKGSSYSTINLARSAVSAYLSSSDCDSIGKHPVVCRIVKGVFENRPALPKYTEIWDVNLLLNHLAKIDFGVSLLKLAMKTACLLLLTTGQRCQSIHSLKTKDIRFTSGKMVIYYSSLLKQSKPGTHVKPAEIPEFEVKSLCPVYHTKLYLDRTTDLRQSDGLFLSSMKPYNHISKDTFSRWIRTNIEEAGIQGFGPHSVRAASSSAAAERLDIDKVLEAGGWNNVKTFAKFYRKDKVIDNKNKNNNFSQSVLDKFIRTH